ncbi:MAG TPA: methionine--tRNA ligase [Candidatus Udaeobacter sp.]|nr:methionine--tRNA ligase [Candidatus Udaeobacter sp.]
MPKTFFITTAIDYTNSPPHVGHAYEKVLADVIARYHRLKGEGVFFLTGVDQHGQKVQQSAAKAGVPPAEFVKDITQKFIDLWKKLDVQYDEWAETISDRHKKVVQGILQRLFDEGQVYKDKQSGHYSVRQEQFLTDKERDADGKFGPEWGQVEFREEENYYFKLSQHKEWLLRYLQSRADAIVPDFRHKELRNAVERLTGDLCISRPKSRLDWGIELPFDKDFVTYVWFDALTNYISFAGYDPSKSNIEHQTSNFLEKWPALQIIGKDVLVPAHGIYWLIMLHAIGFPDNQMPRLLVHGWWNVSGAKMSKSVGNIVDPVVLADKYSSDALRYYLMTDMAMGQDADFSEKRLIERYNGNLANSLGNLLNRTLNMAHRYRQGVVTKTGGDSPLAAQAADLLVKYDHAFERFEIHTAINRLMEFTTACNTYIEMSAPWKLAKDPNRAEALDHVLFVLSESLRIIGVLISPILPSSAREIFYQLNLRKDNNSFDAQWGGLPDRHHLGKPQPLFPRIEIEEIG